MAAPMRDSPLDGATHGSTAAKAATEPAATTTSTTTNFEYDDNEWDVGIGDLIIDLDADIEKTNEKSGPGPGPVPGGGGAGVAPTATPTPTATAMAAAGKTGKLAVEHSATVDKGLKMKIKRTKPGTKTSEAKHEIVKPGELNGAANAGPGAGPGPECLGSVQQQTGVNVTTNSVSGCGSAAVVGGKRGSSGHRRDKKHADKGSALVKQTSAPSSAPVPTSIPTSIAVSAPNPTTGGAPPTVATVPGPGPVVAPLSVTTQQQPPVSTPVQNIDVNGIVRTPVQRVVFPVAVSGPGPPVSPNAPGPPGGPAPGHAHVPAPLPASPTTKPDASKAPAAAVPAIPPVGSMVNSMTVSSATIPHEDSPAAPTIPPSSPSPPLIKKIKTAPVDPKDMLDVCVGTSVGTITEPDCLGPCEPGTSVNLEGIVWHETEGVLVVNVTWRGKTYVGTLLDCTRHDWAPPRFCDSPTSDLDARTPKGRGKRGRGSSNSSSSNDLSNFTETRSSVHSKLRSNSSTNNNGNNKTSSGRRGPNTSSPTPFVPPRPDSGTKRKNRSEEEQQQSPVNGKKTKPGPGVPSASNSTLLPPPSPATPVMNNTSNGNSSPPPTSPVLLECPEPNCSKKYKNINGLKYHQSHAHSGSTDENDDKEMTSLSENEEVPSPPESVVSNKCELSNSSTKKEEPMMVDPPTPIATPVAPVAAVPEPIVSTVPVGAPPTSLISPSQPDKIVPTERILPPDAEMTNDPSLIKQSAGVLRFGLSEESAKTTTVLSVPSPTQRPMSPVNKVPQFKVKPTSALMPEADKKDRSNVKILQQQKKKSKKSPTSSPHLNVMESNFIEQSSGREDVQSPAYSDISDDTAPVLEAETDNKSKVINCEKKSESGTAQSPHSMQHYFYPHYGNPPYLVPSVQTDNKGKELEKAMPESKPISNLEKEKKDTNVGTDYPPKLLEPHFYPYGYVPGYQYGNMGSYPVGMVAGDKEGKEDSILKSPSPAEQNLKQAPPAHITSLPPKIKTESGKLPEKPPSQQNENHQILKESIEIKNQMPPAFIYQRQQPNQPAQPQQQPQPQQVAHQQQQQEDLRRYYLYSGDQRPRKESSSEAPMKATPPPIATKQPPPMPMKIKEKYPSESEKSVKESEKIKQEGVKPTMETQGPPPPPTSSYAYIHPSSYMQSPHYGAIPFDPMRDHSMYRNMNPMLVPGPYGNNPYLHPQLHPQIPRYHAPEDLSRSPSGPKALDLLQHHANQYYSSHKIHELQERAMKSPTPKPVTPGISPSGGGAPNLPQQQPQVQQQQQQGQPQQPPSSITPQPGGVPPPSNKTPTDKDSRSPPPQRHVHTHHHTHVGLGYPILAGQYPAPYGAAVLASQQAAAMASSVANNYPSK